MKLCGEANPMLFLKCGGVVLPAPEAKNKCEMEDTSPSTDLVRVANVE
jgi:hypothetical protein